LHQRMHNRVARRAVFLSLILVTLLVQEYIIARRDVSAWADSYQSAQSTL
jgi:hypothetical protein